MPFDPAKLRALRARRKLTQEALAARLELPREAVARWESGRIAPTLASIERLAAGLDVPAGRLMEVRK